jgi:hypothetical protein
MKEYVKPEIFKISFVSEIVTTGADQGTSDWDGDVDVD